MPSLLDVEVKGGLMERSYRKSMNPKGLVSFEVSVKQTDLWIGADKELSDEARNAVFEARVQLETYISRNPDFRSTLQPWQDDPFAPPMVREMIRASQELSVGPMACVAGAIAQRVGESLLRRTSEVVVENGGDIYANLHRDLVVALLPGVKHPMDRVGLRINYQLMPLGICSSSATIGHSYSKGNADLVTVLAPSASYADGAATAICNMIKHNKDLRLLSQIVEKFKGIVGVVAIAGKAMACWGQIELVQI